MCAIMWWCAFSFLYHCRMLLRCHTAMQAQSGPQCQQSTPSCTATSYAPVTAASTNTAAQRSHLGRRDTTQTAASGAAPAAVASTSSCAAPNIIRSKTVFRTSAAGWRHNRYWLRWQHRKLGAWSCWCWSALAHCVSAAANSRGCPTGNGAACSNTTTHSRSARAFSCSLGNQQPWQQQCCSRCPPGSASSQPVSAAAVATAVAP